MRWYRITGCFCEHYISAILRLENRGAENSLMEHARGNVVQTKEIKIHRKQTGFGPKSQNLVIHTTKQLYGTSSDEQVDFFSIVCTLVN